MLSSMRKRISVPALVAEATDLSTRPSSASSTPSGGNRLSAQTPSIAERSQLPGNTESRSQSVLSSLDVVHSSSPMQLVTSFDVAGAARSPSPRTRKSIVEPIKDLHDGQRLETNSGQLDSQGDAFQSPTKLRDGLPLICVQLQASKYRSGRPGDRQPRYRRTPSPGWRVVGREIRPRRRFLGIVGSWRALEIRAGSQQRVDEERTAVQHVLAVVEEEQDPRSRMCCASVSTAQPVEASAARAHERLRE